MGELGESRRGGFAVYFYFGILTSDDKLVTIWTTRNRQVGLHEKVKLQ